MFKNQKGITLIALVITIIVLLILAGVTIAMLTGSDSAPAKANEAKQKQDIGAAKDQVYIAASTLQTEAYDDAYVKGLDPETKTAVTGTNAGVKVGEYVGKHLHDTSVTGGLDTTKQVGGATIVIKTVDEKTSSDFSNPGFTASTTGKTPTAYIQIYTTDFKIEGWINEAGGTLEWNSNGIVGKTANN